MDARTLEWLESRKLDEEIADRFGIESFQKNGKAWIKIPYFKNGQKVNTKFRCLDEKAFYQEPDGLKTFWNVDAILDPSMTTLPLIITEGEMDALAAIQCGFPKTISVPDGAPAKIVTGENSAKYDYLAGLATVIRANAPYVILATDSDQPGANLLHDLAIRLGRDFCKWVKYPKGCKDFNDALIKYGHAGVTETINRAQWLKLDGVYILENLPPVPDQPVFKSGMSGMDRHFRVRLGDFTVVTGIPGMGKTTWVNDFCCHLAEKTGLKICFASFEQHPSLDHVRNLRRRYLGCRENNWLDGDKERADAWINRFFSFIHPTDMQTMEEDISVSWVIEKAAAAVIRHGANVIVIDPWNELDHIRPRDMTMTDYVSFAIRRFKQFARTYNVHVIIVAHPTKQKKNGDGSYDIPTLYDISDSANWYNKADIGIIVHRNENETILRVAKSRYHEILGEPGDVKFRFNAEINKYECVEI